MSILSVLDNPSSSPSGFSHLGTHFAAARVQKAAKGKGQEECCEQKKGLVRVHFIIDGRRGSGELEMLVMCAESGRFGVGGWLRDCE